MASGGPACEARARGARRRRPARGRSSSTWPDPARAGCTARSAPPWEEHLQPPCRAAAAGPTPAAARRAAACAASRSAPRGLCASRGRCAASASPSKPGLTPRGRWRRGGRVRMRREVELTARRYPFLVGQPALSIQGRGRKDRSAYTCKCACARICCEFPLTPAAPPARRGCTQHSTSRAANKEAHSHTPLGLLLRVIPQTNPRPQGQGAAAACAASPHSGIFHPSRIPPLK